MKKARKLKKNKYQYLCKKYKVDPKKIHVSLIGRISRVKGQNFFCNLAENNEFSNIFEFIIAGKGKSEYINMIFKKTKRIENLYYLGEIENIDEMYAIAHIVIRCDDFFPLGRTVWEGLYSGCKSLLPVSKYDDISEIKKYLNKEIFLYNIRNINSAILKLVEIKNIGFSINENIPTNNIDSYIKEIGKFFNH